jgi:hypothetical protein
MSQATSAQQSPSPTLDSTGLSLELRLAAACGGELTHPSPEAILAKLQPQAPELKLQYAMGRSGWHRLGGVVDGSYRRVAEHIREWAEAQLGDDGGIDALLDRCAAIRGFVTRLEGCTHYLTAVTGGGAGDFVQIEVEQVQEVIERPLWDPDWMPEDIEDFVDPGGFPHLEPEPVGPPRLLFRRLLRVADFLASADAGAKLKRFMADWERSSAGEHARFCEHWCLGVREFRDTLGEGHLSAKPIPLPRTETPELRDDEVKRGAALANLIHGFDRHAGCPFAWYFHMLTRRRVSFQLAEAVHSDLMGAFDYLPPRDIAVLRDWHKEPYSV